MKISDIADQSRINQEPDKIIEILSSGNYTEQGFKIKKVELRLYNEKIDEKLGQYSLITSLVETDKGSIEMIYDEGYRGKNAIESSANFLTSHLGVSGVILRSIIAIRENLEKKNT